MAGTNSGERDSALLALIREHQQRVPARSVDWDALAARIVDSGRAELSARQRLAHAIGAHAPGRWWEVTAGWARPAIAAALVVSAISAAVVLASPTVTVADADDSGTAAWLQTLGAAGNVTVTPALNRDSLLSEVVNQ
jgi:hypothetical protein